MSFRRDRLPPCEENAGTTARRLAAVVGYLAIVTVPFPVIDEATVTLLIRAPLGLLWMFFVLRGATAGRPLSEMLCLKKMRTGDALRIALVFLLLLLAVSALKSGTELLFDRLHIPYREEQDLVAVLRRSGTAEKFLMGIAVVIFAPIGEEIAFRRLLWGMLRPAGEMRALLLTSALFSVGHFYWVGIPSLLVLAVGLQWFFTATGNLRCPIQVHMLFNALAFLGSAVKW